MLSKSLLRLNRFVILSSCDTYFKFINTISVDAAFFLWEGYLSPSLKKKTKKVVRLLARMFLAAEFSIGPLEF